MTMYRRGATAPTRPAVTEEPSYDDLLAEIEQLRARLATGAEAYEQLRASYTCERAALQTALAALRDLGGVAKWLVDSADGPQEAGRFHRVSGPAFRALAEVLALLEDEG